MSSPPLHQESCRERSKFHTHRERERERERERGGGVGGCGKRHIHTDQICRVVRMMDSYYTVAQHLKTLSQHHHRIKSPIYNK